MVKILPIAVEGVTSPYPIVVALTKENHRDLRIDRSILAILRFYDIMIEAITLVTMLSCIKGKKVFEG